MLDGATEKYNKDEINDLKMYMQKLHNFLSCKFLSYNFSYKEIVNIILILVVAGEDILPSHRGCHLWR